MISIRINENNFGKSLINVSFSSVIMGRINVQRIALNVFEISTVTLARIESSLLRLVSAFNSYAKTTF